MDTCTGSAFCERSHKERRTGRWFKVEGSAEVRLRGEIHDEHVRGDQALLLDARGGEEDVGAMADGDSTTGASYL